MWGRRREEGDAGGLRRDDPHETVLFFLLVANAQE